MRDPAYTVVVTTGSIKILRDQADWYEIDVPVKTLVEMPMHGGVKIQGKYYILRLPADAESSERFEIYFPGQGGEWDIVDLPLSSVNELLETIQPRLF